MKKPRMLMAFISIWIFVLLEGCASTSNGVHATADIANTWRVAEQRYQDGDLQAAAELYREAVTAQPQFIDGYLRLGVIAYRRGDLKAAEAYFNEVLRRDPANQKALFDVSLLRLQQARDMIGRYLSVSNRQSSRYAEAQAIAEQLRIVGIAD